MEQCSKMGKEFKLKNKDGNYVVLSDKGASILSVNIAGKDGKRVNLYYNKEVPYNGATIGRVANRIVNSEFKLNGKTYKLPENEGTTHLHGGHEGFDKQTWLSNEEKTKVTFFRVSKDGEQGYPGNLDVTVIYELTDENELVITYKARSDQDTIINLTNHIFFATNNKEDEFQIFSKEYTTLEGDFIPVEGTLYDLREKRIVNPEYDHNYAIGKSGKMKKVAEVDFKKSGIVMEVLTTQPGVQFYNCVKGSFCLETQDYPNAINIKKFPSIILKKGEEYHHVTKYVFK